MRDAEPLRARYNASIMARQNAFQRLWQTALGRADDEAQRVRPFFILLTAAMLFDTLRAAAKGESLLPQAVIARIAAQSGGARTTVSKAASTSEIALTDREQEVLIGVARGGDCGGFAAGLLPKNL